MAANEVSGYIYVPVEHDETYEDAWQHLADYGMAAAVATYDDITHGQRAFIFRVTIHHEDQPLPPQVDVELSSAIDIIDGKLTGPRDDLLLLARTIHDILEGGS